MDRRYTVTQGRNGTLAAAVGLSTLDPTILKSSGILKAAVLKRYNTAPKMPINASTAINKALLVSSRSGRREKFQSYAASPRYTSLPTDGNTETRHRRKSSDTSHLRRCVKPIVNGDYAKEGRR
ncbi:hypothetical protein ACJ73_05924 [Blastomyces percursus]|uniref:Uncharacterized protein n=1 Tax=Blastomyces percursus TaxID=1658174 RepID=A0A1J9QR78_9EURO|nr:hypothetical protein ACJ73_05924 [Blastomyces percursus]